MLHGVHADELLVGLVDLVEGELDGELAVAECRRRDVQVVVQVVVHLFPLDDLLD